MWRQIPGFSLYEISEDGSVRRAWFDVATSKHNPNNPRHKAPHGLLKPVLRRGTGYLGFTLKDDCGKLKNIDTHVLVAMTFHGPRPSLKHNALHWDDNRKNNHYTNIRWGTYKDNEADKARNGNVPWGFKNGNSIFSEDEIIKIRQLYQAGVSARKMSKDMKQSHSAIWRVATRRTYKCF